eukprot:gnl/TRDRNA2_/TRDRNA2_152472_c1_seq1.p1 gnl/TRDRNA2_/TRDRNA2_152472_c1~~gnl/TRDRNA2_/TRDRNA2_152472_c1_seq1.p1  ORF type:complete len:137 (-),score=1.41 gnl/TRDRNA2_/TRDRNA2_152472_c1_seq1:32-442(-)
MGLTTVFCFCEMLIMSFLELQRRCERGMPSRRRLWGDWARVSYESSFPTPHPIITRTLVSNIQRLYHEHTAGQQTLGPLCEEAQKGGSSPDRHRMGLAEPTERPTLQGPATVLARCLMRSCCDVGAVERSVQCARH